MLLLKRNVGQLPILDVLISKGLITNVDVDLTLYLVTYALPLPPSTPTNKRPTSLHHDLNYEHVTLYSFRKWRIIRFVVGGFGLGVV